MGVFLKEPNPYLYKDNDYIRFGNKHGKIKSIGPIATLWLAPEHSRLPASRAEPLGDWCSIKMLTLKKYFFLLFKKIKYPIIYIGDMDPGDGRSAFRGAFLKHPNLYFHKDNEYKVRKKHEKNRLVGPTDAFGLEPGSSCLAVSRAESLGHWWGMKTLP